MKIHCHIYFFIKIFFFITILGSFLGCSSLNTGRIAPSFEGAYGAIKGSLFGYPDPIINREVIDRIPYASALLKIGKGSMGLIILESAKDLRYLWVSKDNVYVETQYGRIIKTEGLVSNLTNVKSINQSFEELLNNPKAVLSYISYYSYDEPYMLDLRVNVSLANKGLQKIEILGEVKSLVLIEESISNDDIRWNRKNLFWIDPKDYFVWKSIQYISPKLPNFTLQVTKRPSPQT